MSAADIDITYDDYDFYTPGGVGLSSAVSLSLAPGSSSSEASTACIQLPESTYIPALTPLPGTPSFGAVLSAVTPGGQRISTFDLTSTASLNTFTEHTDVITALRNTEKLGGNYAQSLLLSTSKDGTVKVWDARIPSSTSSLTIHAFKKAPLVSFDICQSDGCLLAAGSELVGDEAHIMFWDVRWPDKLLHKHSSTHSDDITCMHFQPPGNRPGEVLLTASTDGLICTTDARQSDEEEAGFKVGNWDKSVSHCGWIGDGLGAGDVVWAASDMETLSLWNGELNVTSDYGDMRQPKIPNTWETNYIIDGEWLPEGSTILPESGRQATLGVWLGNNSGDFALCTPGSYRSLSLQRRFHGGGGMKGHSGIVRSVFYDAKHGCIVSGGEDSAIHIWAVGDEGGATLAPDSALPVDEDGDAVMARSSASPKTKPSASIIRKRKNDDPEETVTLINVLHPRTQANKKGRRGF
ncbi:hypothetical protein FRB97_002266 [Tulasnella sp. 331]|nr:hypothetical protein FRB97_002266 [Tulasnella sp. 331]